MKCIWCTWTREINLNLIYFQYYTFINIVTITRSEQSKLFVSTEVRLGKIILIVLWRIKLETWYIHLPEVAGYEYGLKDNNNLICFLSKEQQKKLAKIIISLKVAWLALPYNLTSRNIEGLKNCNFLTRKTGDMIVSSYSVSF